MNYYEILGVSRDASAADIKKAYRTLSKEWHPDKHKGDKAAEEKYKKINEAYEALSDPEKKQRYDQFGSTDGPQFGGFGGGGAGAQGFEGFGDIFESFFGGARRGGQPDLSGKTIEVAITISFAESFTGVQKTIRLRMKSVCKTCDGSGAAKGSTTKSCSNCNGTGQVTRTAQSFFGVIQQSAMCDVCNGSGKVPEKSCETCSGEGRTSGTREVTVDIPAGIHDGQSLRLRSQGEAGQQGAPAGDLYVSIRVTPDTRFARDGDDLRTTVSVPVVDAVLGTEKKVETVGGSVSVKVPAGTQPGQVFRIRGKGMPVLNTSRHGDLYVTVDIEVPKKLGRKEKKVWEELR